jgi:hypothetical protein
MLFSQPAFLQWVSHCRSRAAHQEKPEEQLPGTTDELQVRSIGGTTGPSDWSNPLSQQHSAK